MRAFGSDGRGPSWFIAVLAFVVLIAIMQMVTRNTQQRPLDQHFAASRPAPDAGQIPFPAIPTNIAGLARTTTARLLGGQAVTPLNTADQNESLRVEINTVQQEGEQLRLDGSVTNIGRTPVDVSLDAFRFIDEHQTVYASSGSPATTLQPGQQAPLNLTLPLLNPHQLQLEVSQPGLTPLRLVLINTPPTPTP
jgi:hypothetical protein